MKKVPGSKKMKAVVDTEQCMGCGLCVIGCEQKALKFDLVKPPEYLAVDHQQQQMTPYGDKVPVWASFVSAP
jgi:ferredoxin